MHSTHQDWNAHFVAEFLHYLTIKDNGLLSQPLFHQCLHVVNNFDSPCYNNATDLNTTV